MVDMLQYTEDLIKSVQVNTPIDLNKANSNLYSPEKSILNYEETLIKSMPAESVKAYLENPWHLNEGLGYKNKASSLSYDILHQMSAKCSVIAAIINTRVNQVGLFSRPARNTSDHIGFQITLKDSRIEETPEDKQFILALEQFIEQCGYTYDPYRDSFDTFLRKYVRDSLTYDQACFEIVPDKKGRPAEIICVDAATIRAVSYDENNPDVAWVQLINGAVEAYFKKDELAFCIRNPRSNINVQPYGYSELEMLIQQVTSQLYAEEYNAKFFSNGGMTRGILNLKVDPNGISDREQLNAFKAQWRAQVNGLTGAWKTPVLQIPGGVEFVNIGNVPNDILFSNYMNWLINIACAIYSIDPAEINFPNNGGTVGQNAVFENSHSQAIKNSKDKGLKPLLKFIENQINKHIIRRFSNRLTFQFVGLDESSEAERLEADTKAVRIYKTVNEIRKEHDLEPIECGDTILDASFINMKTQQQAQQQAQPEGAMPMEQPTEEGQPEGETSEKEIEDYDTNDIDYGISGLLDSNDINNEMSNTLFGEGGE